MVPLSLFLIPQNDLILVVPHALASWVTASPQFLQTQKTWHNFWRNWRRTAIVENGIIIVPFINSHKAIASEVLEY